MKVNWTYYGMIIIFMLIAVLVCSLVMADELSGTDLGTLKGEVGETFITAFPIVITSGIFRKTTQEVMVSCRLIILEIENDYALVDIKELYGHKDMEEEIRNLFPMAIKIRREYVYEQTDIVLSIDFNGTPEDLRSR